MLTEEAMIEALLNRMGLVGFIDLTAKVCGRRGVRIAKDDLPSAKVWFRNANRVEGILKDLEA